MTEKGFHASVPELRGFTIVTSELSQGYTTMGKLAGEYCAQGIEAAELKSEYQGIIGLTDALGLLQEECVSLSESHVTACEVMSRALATVEERLNETADEYEGMDLEAEAELRKSNPDADAEKTADAIVQGSSPKETWSTGYKPEDFVTADVQGVVIPEFSFKPTMESTLEVLGEAAGGPSVGTVDAVIEYVCGFSPTQEMVKPLIGDWGVLRFMAELYRNLGAAADENHDLLHEGIKKLLGEHWAGDAAEAFNGRMATWRHVQREHIQLFEQSAIRLDSIADKMEKDAESIAEGVLAMADLAIQIATLGRGGKEKGSVFGLMYDLATTGYSVGEACGTLAVSLMKASKTSLATLRSDLLQLNPPGNLQKYES